jgi:hypothetical protein
MYAREFLDQHGLMGVVTGKGFDVNKWKIY